MIQGLSKTRRRLIGIPIIAGLIFLWLYIIVRVFLNEENLELRGVVVNAGITKVESRYYASGQLSSRYTLHYFYKSCPYTNFIQTGEYTFAKGDSIQIKIDSKNPGAYCAIVN
jgi:hypothetical protein